MHKKTLLITLSCLLTITSTFAQFYSGDMVFGAQTGYKLLGAVRTRSNSGDIPLTRYKNNPMWQTTFDYGLNEVVSLGVAYAAHSGALIHTDGPFIDEVYARYNRVDVGLRLLLHYGNRDNIDLYSGARIGLKIDFVSPETVPNNAVVNNFSTRQFDSLPAIGLVLFGMRLWITDHIAFTNEFHIGRPYFVNIGVATRF